MTIQQEWTVWKVFISSTFLDLELERDAVLQIFIDYQAELHKKRISLVPYDLRWQTPVYDKSVAKWCIQKVQQCQYFVGMLGERYGWCPAYDSNGNANVENLSITHMEIQEALRSVAREKRFFFADRRLLQPQNDDHQKLRSIFNELHD